MATNPAWRLQCKKSIANHYSALLNGIYLEGTHRWKPAETGYELRLNGPSLTHNNESDCFIVVDINVLIRTALTDDIYLCDKMIESVMRSFTDTIALYKYDGVETGPYACLLLKSELMIRHLPQIDATLEVAQAFVQAHYEANVSGDFVQVLNAHGQDYFLLHDTVTGGMKKFWLANGDLQSEQV